MDSIEHKECRRAVFDNLVNFIQQEVHMLSHPDYGYAKMTKKDTKEPKDIVKCRAVDKSDSEVKVNNNKEENEKQVKVRKNDKKNPTCLFCSKLHYVDKCVSFDILKNKIYRGKFTMFRLSVSRTYHNVL